MTESVLQDPSYSLGELLNEFKDEFSYFYFLSQEKLLTGLHLRCSINGDTLVPHTKGNDKIASITRLKHLRTWLSSEVKLIDSKFFFQSMQLFQNFYLTNILLYKGDEITYTFSQNNQEKLVHRQIFDLKEEDKNSNNQYLVMLLTKKGINPDKVINVEIKLTQPSSDRKNIEAILDSIPAKNSEKFFTHFYESLIKPKSNGEITIDQVQNIRCNPRGFFSLYMLLMERDSSFRPKINGIVKQLKSNDILNLSPEYQDRYDELMYKIEDLKHNRFPFT